MNKEAKKFEIPSCDQLKAGIDAFVRKEDRGKLYFIALSHIRENWEYFSEMASGIKLLLDSWHRNFYRFGTFDLNLLSECIAQNFQSVVHFNNRTLFSLSNQDEDEIQRLFNHFLDALRVRKSRSPVAVSKALHLLAPDFYPLWDNNIALAYDTLWGDSAFGVFRYIDFCWKTKDIITTVAKCECMHNPSPKRSLLKLIDEYNYSKFTKRWI
jgi:hypothetical protein